MAESTHLTKRDFEHYLKLDEERLALSRKAKAIADQQETIEAKFFAAAKAHGSKGVYIRSGFVLTIKKKRASVSWKPEFIRVASADEAEKLIKAQPEKEFVELSRAA